MFRLEAKMANQVAIILLVILAAECCVSTAQNCAIYIEDEDIDECESNPCKNGAACVNGVDKFTCSCADGFTGALCNEDNDKCKLNPCENGGTCVNVGVDNFNCLCADGITGPLCFCVEGAMGMEDGSILDSQLTASSQWQDWSGPEKARLNYNKGSWVARSKDTSPWIQVEFQEKVYITGVITQGGEKEANWVREYQVAFSQDDTTWTYVVDTEGVPITFDGITDANTEVTKRFPAAVTARYLRIYPTASNGDTSMRFEVLGCATA